ncbi:hypothetical protein V8C26DRAFT_196503 [Trichoderma gracile]
MPDPVQRGHSHVLHFDFKRPPTFVSSTKKLDSADPDSDKTIKFFSNLVNLPTLDLPLSLATVSPLPAAATASTPKTNLTVLEDMCKAFEDADGMHSILSCLRLSTLYNGKGGFPTTAAQFPEASPPDYASSRKRPALDSTASQPGPRQRPRLGDQSDSVLLGALQPQPEQPRLGLDLFEKMSRRLDTLTQQLESDRTATDARLKSMIEAHSDIQLRRYQTLTDELDAQRARFDVLLARSDTRRARSDTRRARSDTRRARQ